MSYTIIREPDCYFETIRAVVSHISGDTLAEFRRQRLARPGRDNVETAALLAAVLDGPEKLSNEIYELVDPENETPRFLFGAGEELSPLATVFWYYRNLRDPSASGKIRAIHLHVEEDEENPCDPAQAYEEADLYAWLDTLRLSGETKYSLIKLYRGFDEYLAYVDDLAARARPLFDAAMPEEKIRAVTERVRENLEEKGISFLAELLKVDLEETDEYLIRPMIVAPNSLSVYALEKVHLFFGLGLFDLVPVMDGKTIGRERIGDFLKALSEPTKLSILQLLRERTMFSRELADALGLTGATISHHMSTLTGLRLVSIAKRGNRVYYELDGETARAYLDALYGLIG